MSLILEKPKRGRPAGSVTNNVYKWEVLVFDKTTNTFNKGKCKSLADINKQFELNLTHDLVKRIETKFRADMTMRNKENSFLARWGHIEIKKINEKV